MNNIRTSLVGIDTVIQPLQTELYDKLVTLWGDNIDAYGRIYKNIDAQGDSLPEFYLGKNDYRDAFHNDSKICTLFFIKKGSSKTEDELVFVSTIKCVFMVNLEKAYPSDTDRVDADAQRDVIQIMRNLFFSGAIIQGVDEDIKDIFSGFKTDGIKFSNIHPYHCFSVNVDLSYYVTDKCL